MTRFEPALCSVTFRALPPEAVVALAVDAKLAGIEWGGDVHVPAGDLDTARRVAALTQRAGLRVTSYGSYVAPPADGLDAFHAALDTTLALGARHLRLWAGTRQKASKLYDAPERAEAVRLIDAMGAAAEARGVTVGLEYHPDSLTDSLASASQLVREVSAPSLYLYWQPRPGLPLAEALEEIAAVGPDVCHVHVFAWNRERERFPLQTQAEAWRAMISAVPAGRWQGPRYAMLEFVRDDAPQAFREDAAILRTILGAPDL